MKRGEEARALVSEADEAPQSEARPRRRSVLVPLYGRRAPGVAIEMARVVASALHEPLHGMFFSPEPVAASEVPRRMQLSPSALDGFVIDVEVGDPVERLAAFAERYPTSFLVIETDPEGQNDEGLGVGDFAARLIEASKAPVLLVPPGTTPRLERILLPLDGTPSTASALEPAGELARQVGASLDILLVGGARNAPQSEHGAMSPPQYVDQPQHEWPAFSDEFLHRFLTGIGHCPEDVPTRFHLGAGDPADQILRHAGDLASHLTVLVWHGHLDDRHGSVFRTVLQRAHGPVLVLRC
ncbi:universal stress protein [Polyangium aurulentum]|uniref:universal stress protein n=1 Tax=Polyangium aurulentum TaxID=2567896 RepID=UPI0010ADB8E4|nr:universal stress protein [Polyangium aurulentum]UQA61608.1 universal stress protein [Polyangium aurulentum]